MTDREAMRLALDALESAADNECNFHDYKHAAAALRQALAQQQLSDSIRPKGKSITKVWVDEINQALEQPECNPHPDAPHGFNRESSHSLGRYVCDCEGWEPEEQEPVTWRNAAIRLGEDLYSVGPNGYYDMTASQWLDWALSVVNTVPPNSTTDVVEPEACIVGIKGSAYDPIDTKRAYTYANQPGNVVAYKLGRASSSASLQRAGDFIDSGLILLKELQVEGYGVFDIGAEYTAPPSKPWVSLTDEEIAEGARQSWVDKQAFESAVWWAEEKLKEKNT